MGIDGLGAGAFVFSPVGRQSQVGERTQATVPLPEDADREDVNYIVEKTSQEVAEEEKGSFLERILEVGFGQFVEEVEEEKREKMREEILARMGLTEESLSNMSAEQRQVIETMIEEEIQRRMAGAAAANNDKKDHAAKPGAGTSSLVSPLGNLALGPNMPSAGEGMRAAPGMGLGPVLAWQEIASAEAGAVDENDTDQPGKKEPEKP